MANDIEKHHRLIKHLEDALHLAKELNDLTTSHFIERALAGARARQLRPPTVA